MRRVWLIVVLAAGLVSAGFARAQAPPAIRFEQDIRPLLDSHCAKCHGTQKKKGDIDFSPFIDSASTLRGGKVWRKAITEIEAGNMPPEHQTQLAPGERDQLLKWMRQMQKSLEALRDPGPSVARRLSLGEYDRSIRDLLNVEFNSAQAVGMPDDAPLTGFDNLGGSLTMSASQLEKYFIAADKVLDRLFGTEISSNPNIDPSRAKRSLEKILLPHEKPGVSERDAARQVLTSLAHRAYRRPVDDKEIDQLMALYNRGPGPMPTFNTRLRLAMKAVLVSPHFLLRAEPAPAADAATSANAVIAVDDYELASRLSYFLWSSVPDQQLLDLADRGKLQLEGPLTEPIKLAGNPISTPGTEQQTGNNRDKVFDNDLSTAYDNKTAPGFWLGLDLGSVRPINRIRYAGRVGSEARMIGGKFQAAMDAQFTQGLVDLFTIKDAPPRLNFALRELDAGITGRYVRYIPPPRSNGVVAEIQVWGMDSGTVLEQQVRRMLADPKARALTDRFAVQWLGLRKLDTARPTTEFFPTFSSELRSAMRDETTLFFDHLRTEDRSVLELLDADYTYLNAELAKHYGIPGVEGKEMRRVELKPEYHRGGLLGMGSVLSMTSHVSRTSPTLRGKWILATIFGTPPAPPPPDAGEIKEKGDASKIKTFREQLAQHATNATCAACHRKMDPLGFALDNYNAIGIWRDKAGDQPLDVSGMLPSGERFTGIAGLKAVIKARQSEFVRNMVSQMMTYALGRELDYYDENTIRQIQASVEQNNGKMSAMVLGVARSLPFRYRRAGEAPVATAVNAGEAR